MAKRWYVVHAYSGYEKKVAGSLRERIELHQMEDQFGEVLVPTEEVVEMRVSSFPVMCWCKWNLTTTLGIWLKTLHE